ncbi:hypothetical protein G6F22_020339 [Rhizopus arrhizus]|nr:hypothetical protein G6F22_020339 [Rhizopus arrhizus]
MGTSNHSQACQQHEGGDGQDNGGDAVGLVIRIRQHHRQVVTARRCDAERGRPSHEKRLQPDSFGAVQARQYRGHGQRNRLGRGRT